MNNVKKENKKNDNFPLVSVCVIIIITLLLMVPLFVEVRDKIPLFADKGEVAPKISEAEAESPKKIYKAAVNYIDSSIPDSESGALLSVKVRNNGDALFLYAEETEYSGNALRLMKKSAAVSSDEEDIISVSEYIFPQLLYESVRDNNYTYTDFGDDYIFLSNNKIGYLFNVSSMKAEKIYRMPKDYNIYQCVLSGDREKIAFTAETGLYISDCDFENIKELVSTVYALNNTVITSKFPVWAKDDAYIFYRLYANDNMNGIGKTSVSPGNNRQHIGVGTVKFAFLSGDRIFYHQSSSATTEVENQFICGYFDLETKEMKDKIKSSVYYYDVKTGKNGNFIAALSNNGMLKKLNIIDINSKKIIYYGLFDEIIEFYFSPDETKLIIRAVKDGGETLLLVDIYESGSNQIS